MLNHDYNALPGITASAIKAGRRSMAHMRLEMKRDRNAQEGTTAMRTGTLAHMALLEPDRFATLVQWDAARRGKEWDVFKAHHGADNIVTKDEWATAIVMAHTAIADRHVKDTFSRVDRFEHTIQWQDGKYGSAKCRVDAIGANCFIEYKTTSNVSERAFINQSETLGYYLQLAWYWHGAGRPQQVFVVAQENKEPFPCGVFEVDTSDLKSWYLEAEEIAMRYRACEAVNNFPMIHDAILTFKRPEWTGGGDWVME